MAKLEKPTDLAGWRDYARRLEARASRKIAKIKAGTYNPTALRPIAYLNTGGNGIDIAHTGLDPRKGTPVVGRMTKAQVEAHAHRLEEFMAPNVSYYSSAEGTPISAKAMLQHKYAVKAKNNRIFEYFDRVGGTNIPWRGNLSFSTIYRPDSKYDSTAANNSELRYETPAKPTEFLSEEGVRQDARVIMERTTPRYEEARIAKLRQTIAKMIDGSGDDSMRKVLDLPDDVLFIMWNADDKLARTIAFNYHAQQEMDEMGSPDDEYIHGYLMEDKDDMFNYGQQMQVKADAEADELDSAGSVGATEHRRRLRNERRRRIRNKFA